MRTDAATKNGALHEAQAASAVGRLAYVKLSRDIDIEKHKLPQEKNYLNIFYDYHDAKRWIHRNGVALNLFLTTLDLAIVDVDRDDEDARDFVRYCIANNHVVFKSIRGYHIFVKNNFNVSSNSVVVSYDNKSIDAELYKSSDRRIIVLNITSTPRSLLVYKVSIVEGVYLDVSLDEFEYIMRNLNEASFSVQERKQKVSAKSFFQDLIGKKSFTKQDFFDAVRKNATPGNRNNLFCKAAIFAATHYTRQDLEKLREIMLELYSDEVNYEKKIDNIIKTAIMKAKKVKSEINLHKKKNGIEAALEFLKMNNARVYYYENDVYILIHKYAISIDYLSAYLASHSINLNKNDEEKIKKMLSADNSLLDIEYDAIILENTIVYKNNKLYFRTCDNKICVVSKDSIEKYDCLDNVYLLYKKCRCYNIDDVADIDFVFKAFADYTQMEGKVAVSLFLTAILNIASAAFVVEGPSGAGKTTLARFLQYIANAGATTTTLNNNARDVVSVLKNQHLVCFDEKIPNEIRFLIKSAITSAEYVTRELFKNKDIIRMRFKNSFIFTQISLQDLEEDEARRTLVIRLQKRNTNIMSTKIQQFIEENHSKIFAALLNIAKDVLKLLESLDYESLPRLIRDDKNIDYAVVAYLTSVVLNCESEFINVYKKCRYASFEKSLSVFAEIIKLKNMSSEFNKKIQENYMTATEIAEELIKNKEIYNIKIDDENAYSLSRKISKVACDESVKESLEQMSYILETKLIYNKQTKKQVKAYRITNKND
jgi:hypothetical protein